MGLFKHVNEAELLKPLLEKKENTLLEEINLATPEFSLEIGEAVDLNLEIDYLKFKKIKTDIYPAGVIGLVKKEKEDEKGNLFITLILRGLSNGKAKFVISVGKKIIKEAYVTSGNGKLSHDDNIVELNNTRIAFEVGGEERVIINHMNLGIHRGEIFGLVGESGSGKTTVGRAIIRVNKVSGGSITYNGVKISGKIAKPIERALKTRMQMIFQDPAASLNDRANVDYIVSEGLRAFHLYKDEEDRLQKVENIMKEVGLRPEHLTRYPHEFSGGQRQRIGIARCMVMNPEFIIADEPISALDVSIRAQVLNLIKTFQKNNSMTVLFIAHDLSVVRYISDRIGVIYGGKLVELTEANRLFECPLHPYTKSLLSAIPIPDPRVEKYKKVVVYNPFSHEYDFENDQPDLYEVEPGHWVRCDLKELKQYQKELKEGK